MRLLHINNIWRERHEAKGFRSLYERRLLCDGFFESAAILAPPAPGRAEHMEIVEEPVSWHAMEGGKRQGLAQILAGLATRAAKLHRQRPFDVIWASDPALCLVAGALISKLCDIPLITSYQCDPATVFEAENRSWLTGSEYLHNFLENLAMNCSQGHLTYSLGQKQWFRTRTPAIAVYDFFNTPDLKMFLDVQRNPAGPWLYLGILEPHKDPVTIARAWINYKKSGGNRGLYFVGDGSLLGDLEHMLAPFDDAVIAGFRIQKDLPDILGKCAGAIHSSLSEGFSNALMECQAAGLPLIGSDIPSIREGLIDPEIIYFPVGNAEILGELMHEFDQKPEAMELASCRAKAKVSHWLLRSPERHNHDVMKLILERYRPSPCAG